MIEYLKDMSVIGSKITTCPYTLKGSIAIVRNGGKNVRCPAWGSGREVLKFDKKFIYIKSDNANKIDVFDEMGVNVKEMDTKNLG